MLRFTSVSMALSSDCRRSQSSRSHSGTSSGSLRDMLDDVIYMYTANWIHRDEARMMILLPSTLARAEQKNTVVSTEKEAALSKSPNKVEAKSKRQ